MARSGKFHVKHRSSIWNLQELFLANQTGVFTDVHLNILYMLCLFIAGYDLFEVGMCHGFKVGKHGR